MSKRYIVPSIMASNIADGLITNKPLIKLEDIWLCHTLFLYTTDYYIVALSACVVHYKVYSVVGLWHTS